MPLQQSRVQQNVRVRVKARLGLETRATAEIWETAGMVETFNRCAAATEIVWGRVLHVRGTGQNQDEVTRLSYTDTLTGTLMH